MDTVGISLVKDDGNIIIDLANGQEMVLPLASAKKLAEHIMFLLGAEDRDAAMHQALAEQLMQMQGIVGLLSQISDRIGRLEGRQPAMVH